MKHERMKRRGCCEKERREKVKVVMFCIARGDVKDAPLGLVPIRNGRLVSGGRLARSYVISAQLTNHGSDDDCSRGVNEASEASRRKGALITVGCVLDTA